MTSTIRTYEELLQERNRLEGLLKTQKQQIQLDVRQIKEELQPAFTIISILGKFIAPEERNGALVNTGAGITIDWVIRRFFSKSLLLQRFLPGLLKNASSHLLHPLISKISNGIKKLRRG